MKIVVVIPARYGSTRLDGKPLVHISGEPMIKRVYERVHQAKNISKVVVATDDQRILDAVREFGGEVLMTAPENRCGTDRVADAAQQLGLAPTDIVVNVQGDQPLIDPRCIEELIMPFLDDPSVSMATLAFKILDERERTDPKDVKVTFDNHGNALYFSRAPIPWARDAGESYDMYKHLGVYAYTQKFLEVFRHLPEGALERIEKLEQLRVLEYGYNIKTVVTEYDSPEVDLPEDISRIETLIASGLG